MYITCNKNMPPFVTNTITNAMITSYVKSNSAGFYDAIITTAPMITISFNITATATNMTNMTSSRTSSSPLYPFCSVLFSSTSFYFSFWILNKSSSCVISFQQRSQWHSLHLTRWNCLRLNCPPLRQFLTSTCCLTDRWRPSRNWSTGLLINTSIM